MPLRLYTDGACRGNPGPGGWAWAESADRYASGHAIETTNQRMELNAAIMALRANPVEPVVVVSDSTYVINCFKDSWHVGWQRRGWRTSQGKPVKNRDLWEDLIALVLDEDREVKFEWVKGHSGDRMNDFVDLLATNAADTQRSSTKGS